MGTTIYNFKRTKWHWTQLVQEGKYYQINGTKKVLYWDGLQWRQPIKDTQSKSTLVFPLEKQPTNVKTVKEVAPNCIGYL